MGNSIIQIIMQSCIFFPLVSAVSLSFNILKIPDLTVEGSFVIGAAVFARLLTENYDPFVGMAAACMAGALAGTMTSFMHRCNVAPLISGVLAIFILSSATLIVMGRPNISILGKDTIITIFQGFMPLQEKASKTLFFIIVAATTMTFLSVMMSSRIGLFLRAFGDNKQFLLRLGKDAEMYRIIGLVISNALAAMCGALTAQVNGYADSAMGLGVGLIGIGTVIIGNQLYGAAFGDEKKPHHVMLMFCFAGVVIYFTAMNFFIKLQLNPIYLKMIMGVTLASFLMTAKPEKHMEGAL
ncbi:MAG: ABC transporter permease [Waddliaceae bacterium]|nr:ABC transporter permease [Waddliaceae bacterium]